MILVSFCPDNLEWAADIGPAGYKTVKVWRNLGLSLSFRQTWGSVGYDAVFDWRYQKWEIVLALPSILVLLLKIFNQIICWSLCVLFVLYIVFLLDKNYSVVSSFYSLHYTILYLAQ